ncbi:hypothetical protein ABH935_005443 [Catenulispora sp. GAS73]|uniref:hypothetical protein n=1 Tax=Catenulispora sp. GAS73 TaxID=3156269 RepID=UPI003518DC43
MPDQLTGKEFVGDRVTQEVHEAIDHHGDIIVRAKYDGDYDKADLLEVLVMTSCFALRRGRISSLTIIFNQPSQLFAQPGRGDEVAQLRRDIWSRPGRPAFPGLWRACLAYASRRGWPSSAAAEPAQAVIGGVDLAPAGSSFSGAPSWQASAAC